MLADRIGLYRDGNSASQATTQSTALGRTDIDHQEEARTKGSEEQAAAGDQAPDEVGQLKSQVADLEAKLAAADEHHKTSVQESESDAAKATDTISQLQAELENLRARRKETITRHIAPAVKTITQRLTLRSVSLDCFMQTILTLWYAATRITAAELSQRQFAVRYGMPLWYADIQRIYCMRAVCLGWAATIEQTRLEKLSLGLHKRLQRGITQQVSFALLYAQRFCLTNAIAEWAREVRGKRLATLQAKVEDLETLHATKFEEAQRFEAEAVKASKTISQLNAELEEVDRMQRDLMPQIMLRKRHVASIAALTAANLRTLHEALVGKVILHWAGAAKAGRESAVGKARTEELEALHAAKVEDAQRFEAEAVNASETLSQSNAELDNGDRSPEGTRSLAQIGPRSVFIDLFSVQKARRPEEATQACSSKKADSGGALSNRDESPDEHRDNAGPGCPIGGLVNGGAVGTGLDRAVQNNKKADSDAALSSNELKVAKSSWPHSLSRGESPGLVVTPSVLPPSFGDSLQAPEGDDDIVTAHDISNSPPVHDGCFVDVTTPTAAELVESGSTFEANRIEALGPDSFLGRRICTLEKTKRWKIGDIFTVCGGTTTSFRVQGGFMFDKRLIGKQWKWTEDDTHVDQHDQGSIESPPLDSEGKYRNSAPQEVVAPPPTSRLGNPLWDDMRDSDNDDHDDDVADLVRTVKKLQAQGLADHWRKHCISNHKKSYDPARQEGSFLRAYISEADKVQQHPTAAAPSNRYVGDISALYPEKKCGFIKSEQVTIEFGMDCFVSAFELGAFSVGSRIRFTVVLNKQGKPQARDVQEASIARVTDPFTPCWYFANKGWCKHGDDCTFTHENKVSQPSRAMRKSTNADAVGKGAGSKPARVWVPK